MRWVSLLVIAAALMAAVAMPAAAATVITISASPQQAHIGDIVTLNGNISGITTIAVYLFVIGPDLDTRGVTLDNLNIPAGRGLFTTAPVQLSDGRLDVYLGYLGDSWRHETRKLYRVCRKFPSRSLKICKGRFCYGRNRVSSL